MNTPLCPVAGTPGHRVPAATLQALIKPERRAELRPIRYRFCPTPGCDVVYYAEDGSQVFSRVDLVVRVGLKEEAPPRPVCYCFGHTVEEMAAEIAQTGTTTVPARIRERLEAEGCQCERTNPQGTCCLGRVQALADQLRLQENC